MRSRSPAVVEDVRIGAAGLLQGVRQDRQAVEGTILVDRRCEPHDGAVPGAQPARVNPGRAEGVPEDLAYQPGHWPVATLGTCIEARLSRDISVCPGRFSSSQACSWAAAPGSAVTVRS